MTKPKKGGVGKKDTQRRKKKGRLYYQTPPNFAVARENATFFSSRGIMRPPLDKEETATKGRGGERRSKNNRRGLGKTSQLIDVVAGSGGR